MDPFADFQTGFSSSLCLIGVSVCMITMLIDFSVFSFTEGAGSMFYYLGFTDAFTDFSGLAWSSYSLTFTFSFIDFSIRLLWQLFYFCSSCEAFLLSFTDFSPSGGVGRTRGAVSSIFSLCDCLREGVGCCSFGYSLFSCSFTFFFTSAFSLSAILSFCLQCSSSFSRSFFTSCCRVKCLLWLNSVQKLLLDYRSAFSSWKERKELLWERVSCSILASRVRSFSISASMFFSLFIESGSVRQNCPSRYVATHSLGAVGCASAGAVWECAAGEAGGWLRWEAQACGLWDWMLECRDMCLIILLIGFIIWAQHHYILQELTSNSYSRANLRTLYRPHWFANASFDDNMYDVLVIDSIWYDQSSKISCSALSQSRPSSSVSSSFSSPCLFLLSYSRYSMLFSNLFNSLCVFSSFWRSQSSTLGVFLLTSGLCNSFSRQVQQLTRQTRSRTRQCTLLWKTHSNPSTNRSSPARQPHTNSTLRTRDAQEVFSHSDDEDEKLSRATYTAIARTRQRTASLSSPLTMCFMGERFNNIFNCKIRLLKCFATDQSFYIPVPSRIDPYVCADQLQLHPWA